MKKIERLFTILLTTMICFSSCKNETKPDIIKPSPVSELKATSEIGKVILTWKDPNDSDLYAIKIFNGIEVSARVSNLTNGVLIGKGLQRYEITGLENNKSYFFKVAAVDEELNESDVVETEIITFIDKVVEKEVEVKQYVCPKCEKLYETSQEAIDCCGVQIVEKQEIVYKYICPKCKEEYTTEQEAANCCGIQIQYVDREVEKIIRKYVCPRDGKEHNTIQEAEECCGPVETEKLVYTSLIPAGIYNIYHLQQKVTGGKKISDYIVQDTDESKNITIDANMAALSKTYSGFTAKSMSQNETSIYIFYDRDLITYSFSTGTGGKLSDGNSEKIVKGLYGASVSVPIAISDLYDFDGWITSSNEILQSTFGNKDLVFIAKWIEKVEGGFNWYEIPVDVETGKVATLSSKYIYFGVFPKTVLPKNGAISIDRSEITKMGLNTYYKGNDGNWYAEVIENRYEYNDCTYSDGSVVNLNDTLTIRYFKVEPIKWKVLSTNYNETGKVLLFAEDILTANVPYYVNTSTRTIKESTVYASNYKYSTIRAYLNGAYEKEDTQTKTEYKGKGFLQTAFTENAQLLIEETIVDNSAESKVYSASSYAKEYACDNTRDKIFLLSQCDVVNNDYGFATYLGSGTNGNTGRIREITDYAKANNADQKSTSDTAGYYWLRSPYNDYSYRVYAVSSNGSASLYNNVNTTYYGVVPALTIVLNQSIAN